MYTILGNFSATQINSRSVQCQATPAIKEYAVCKELEGSSAPKYDAMSVRKCICQLILGMVHQAPLQCQYLFDCLFLFRHYVAVYFHVIYSAQPVMLLITCKRSNQLLARTKRIKYTRSFPCYMFRRWGHAVAQLVEALSYKSEGREFDSRWCHWNFLLT
jgi:hypothetical protein